jgi:hypothetical protein
MRRGWPVALLVLSLAAASCSEEPYPPEMQRDAEYVRPTHDQQMWAVATCAVLAEWRGDRHDLLSAREPSDEAAGAMAKTLREWWGISSRSDLLRMLGWIDAGGHRKGFDENCAIVTQLTPEDLEANRERLSGNAEALHRIDVLEAHCEALGEKSIIGWDYGRYVALCRWGYLVGYLSEDEAWERIMPVARMLQQVFDSWEDLGENYLTGRQYWSYEQTERSGEKLREAFERLRTDPESPWRKLPWDLDLSLPSTGLNE